MPSFTAGPRPRRQRGGQAIVSALDPVHLVRHRRVVGRELIDEREQRELVGIAKEEAAEPKRRLAQLVVCVDAVQPLGDGFPSDVGDDRRFPAPFGEAVGFAELGHLFGEAIPAAGDAAPHDARPAMFVRAHEAPAAAEDAGQLEAELRRELLDFPLRSVDEIGAALGVLAVLETVPNRPGTAADAIAGFDDGDGGAEGLQVTSGSEPREPCARHKD